jgi:hypothetical protein
VTKELAAASRQCTVSHFFLPEHFYQKQNFYRPHPPYFSLFPRLKIKLIGLHFDTIEVIEAESHAILNALTEYDFQDAFKNGRISGNYSYAGNETSSRVMVASRSNKVID